MKKRTLAMRNVVRAVAVSAPKVGGWTLAVALAVVSCAAALAAQAPSAPAPAGVAAPKPAATTPDAPSDYVIGTDDILQIIFWKDKDMTTKVVVRPDGKISLPVLNEIQASGLTPEQLRAAVITAASKFFEEPSVNVVVEQINSRKVYVMGEVVKPGTYPITGNVSVIQIIALAGGLSEYAKKDNIAVLRTENGLPKRYKVNYNDILNGKRLKENNIQLLPGDTVVIP